MHSETLLEELEDLEKAVVDHAAIAVPVALVVLGLLVAGLCCTKPCRRLRRSLFSADRAQMQDSLVEMPAPSTTDTRHPSEFCPDLSFHVQISDHGDAEQKP